MPVSNGNGSVRLSPSNWVAIVALVVAQFVGGTAFVLSREGRLASLEAKVSSLASSVAELRVDLRAVRASQIRNGDRGTYSSREGVRQ